MNRKVISEIIALLYVCLMLYTAIAKLGEYDLSREQMAMMPILTPFAHVIVWLLPTIEIFIAILLYVPRYRLFGLYSVTTLMSVFTLYIIYMMCFYKHLPCSCGGLMEELSWSGHLIFNSVFLLLGLIGIKLLKPGQRKDKVMPLVLNVKEKM